MSQPFTSDTITHGIRVRAAAHYLPGQSSPAEGRYMFAYRIVISNESASSVKLLSRHWVIINGNGVRQDVEGPGVVGKTPALEPGGSFKYTSFCPLDTEWGSMEGTYRMERDEGEEFDAVIGRFFLATNAPALATSK